MLHEELTHSIIGAGMEVLSVLKPGLDEKIYERAMAVELGIRGLAINQQRQFPRVVQGARSWHFDTRLYCRKQSHCRSQSCIRVQ